MTTVERVIKECKEQNIPLSKIERDLGFGNGYFRSLKKGDLPYERLEKVAEYLGVRMEWLIFGSYLQFNDPMVSDELAFMADIEERDPEYFKALVEFVRRTYRDEEGETT